MRVFASCGERSQRPGSPLICVPAASTWEAQDEMVQVTRWLRGTVVTPLAADPNLLS